MVKEFARKKGLKVIEISGNVIFQNLFKKYIYQTLNVKQFLTLILNSEYVFSSSFHGIAFSILFEKQFLALDTGNLFGRVK